MGWVVCAASPECTGSARPPYGRCLAHLERDELGEVIRGLAPGSPVDLRGTVVGEDLLEQVLTATRRTLGRARFDWALFPDEARFGAVLFRGDASFDHAAFHRLASFYDARFTGNVSFGEVRFARELSLHGVTVTGHAALDRVVAGGDALFGSARFGRTSSFRHAEFRGFTSFDDARFAGDAGFRGCRFGRTVSFHKARFDGLAGFEAVRFSARTYLTPAVTGRRLTLAGARASGALELSAAGCPVDLRRLHASGELTVRLQDAEVDLEEATLRGPAAVIGRGTARVVSLRGVEAESLELTRLDLTACRFAGFPRPDRVRLTGCAFAAAPRGLRFPSKWPILRWWPGRRRIAEEHAWHEWSSPPAGTPADPPAGRSAAPPADPPASAPPAHLAG
ncbi:hypothetical protein Pta02_23060 [Planobispora takensis]|uniref:Pentapeptide repeat-containing protein n=2 Tax=Planobispora takensis TaxID=1367882 RepID=A0A8J3SU41_9ACTN|nr:hypothetical protein Pta02_23060 [Planobispora takensis]